jgi:hypothetical protein
MFYLCNFQSLLLISSANDIQVYYVYKLVLMKLTIFYSWQSDTNQKYNRFYIKDSIDKAVKKLKKIPETANIQYIVQEGITGEPGSPAVANTITDERIPGSDIFIADLSVINRKSKWVDYFLKVVKQYQRPQPNPNVMMEYGVAFRTHSSRRIIGVMNRKYGGTENLPFDLKHLRFPIQYMYGKGLEKKDHQEAFVFALRDAIKDISIFVHEHAKQKFRPFLVWDAWEQIIPQDQSYVATEKTKEISSSIMNSLVSEQNVIRLLGLSGLGKTRILFEMFRPLHGNALSSILTGRMLYYDSNSDPTIHIKAVVQDIINTGDEHIIILDNCPVELCRSLMPLIKATNSRVSLITIDNNPEEAEMNAIGDASYYVIKKEDLSEVVEVIVTKDFGELPIESVDKIKEFAQGIPMMAVLLGQSARNGEQFLGRLNDKFLLDNLLGNFAKDPEIRVLLKTSSLFNYFGYQDEYAVQLDFIATNKNITITNSESHVVLDKFHSMINHYLNRGIFEQRGRLLSMRPFPLAMYLAQEWLQTCTPDRLINMIINIAALEHPHRKMLAEALSEQMKYLGYDNKAIEIVERVTGTDSPFDNAEVLNTELGSRLFRAFVEVNPDAIADNLYRNFIERTTLPIEEVIGGRRNLVWVLEKLCFNGSTFEKGIKVLFAFAVAENETWGNNATGQFLHLFKIMLAGTEASLIERFNIIEWGLNHKSMRYQELSIEAISRALSFGHFTRMGGAEKQGTRVLIDYKPRYDEIKHYWELILNRCLILIRTDSGFRDRVLEIILQSLRGIIRAGFASIILPIIVEIINVIDGQWDSALTYFKQTLKFDRSSLTNDQIEQLSSLLISITKQDFISKYQRIIVRQELDQLEIADHKTVILIVENLAVEFLSSELNWAETVPMFFKRKQFYAYYFGTSLYRSLNKDLPSLKIFIDLGILAISDLTRDSCDVSVMGGIYAESDQETKAYILSKLNDYDELNYLFFYFISLERDAYKRTDVLFNLLKSRMVDVSEFLIFSRNGFSDADVNDLLKFCAQLFEYGKDGYLVAFKILSSSVFLQPDREIIALPTLRECIIQLGIIEAPSQIDEYQWWETIRKILEINFDVEFALLVNRTLINSISWENTFHLNHEVSELYKLLLERYFEVVWPEIADNLLGEDELYIKFYGLKQILGSTIGLIRRKNGVIVSGDSQILIGWAKDNQPIGPARLAQLIPVFDDTSERTTPSWHPVAKQLIDEFGDYEDVLNEISANLGTFSWTGSIIPYLQIQIQLMEQLENHHKTKVVEWALRNINYLRKNIKTEIDRDQERKLR